MNSTISFILDGKITEINFKSSNGISPTTTVLNFLRELPDHKGVKEGCAEGDCGACTVVLSELEDEHIRYKAVDSCLVFLPMLHGKQLITVENLKDPKGTLHPVQSALVEMYGSQCGFCTPGIVMSMFELYKNYPKPSRVEIDDVLTGNLCRCTGYRPIVDAAVLACKHNSVDHFTKDENRIVELLKSISGESIHIKTEKQKYFRPASLDEALSLKAQYPGAIILSGATDVALRVTKGHELLTEIIDLSGIKQLRKINESDSALTIGAGVVMNDVRKGVKKDFPALFEMLNLFASNQIRNVATLGGNLGTASPIGDALPVLMAYGAKIELQSIKEKRQVSLNDYFIGYRKTIRQPDELITSVILPKSSNGTIVKSYKISKRKDLDISTLSAGFSLGLDNDIVKSITLAYGGMAEITKRAVATEKFLLGKKWDRNNIELAMEFIAEDFTPISDVRGSKEYRATAAKNVLMKLWNETKIKD